MFHPFQKAGSYLEADVLKQNKFTKQTMGHEPTITPADFTRWNYGGLTQASQEEDEAGYTEFADEVKMTAGRDGGNILILEYAIKLGNSNYVNT